jgi:hypothetical protein
MGGGVPASTTSTTTVNQSPWQNPTYQALMLGTKDRPGPITNVLRSNQGYMDAYNRMLGQGITPADVVKSGKYNPSASSPGVTFQNQAPTQTAADGGVMSLQGYAPGGVTTKSLSPAQVAAVNKYNNLVAKGETPPEALVNQLNEIERKTNRNVSPFVDSGIAAVGNQRLQTSIAKAAASGNYPKDIAGTSPYADVAQIYPNSGAVRTYDKTQKDTADKAAADAVAAKDSAAREDILKQSLGQTAGIKVNEQGEFESTNPLFNQTIQRLQDAQKLPDQFGQATDAYTKAISGLQGMTNYTPQQVAAQQIEAANIDRSSIRDVNAQRAEVERMQAAMMQAPTEANVRDYEAAQAQLNQMQGPKSWTDQGTAAQYMSPYMQNVVDIQKREANRDFAKQMARLDAQAVGQGAFGGSRNALERSEARRAQAQRLGDIQAQGQQQAYQSGMGQFSAEQGLGLQAGQANLSAAQQTAMANQQALNQQRQQYVNNALQTAMQSYGGQLTAAQQNQVAQNAESQFNAQSQNTANNNYVQQQLTAQLQNQGMDFNTAQQNAAMLMQSRTANQQAALQASMANQSAGLQANQQNLGAYGQMLGGAQGLGALGASQAQTNLANIGALGQGASAWQNLMQQYFNTQSNNALNTINFPSTLNAPVFNAISGTGVQGGSSTTTGTSSSATPFGGRAEGGSVEAHKEWDKAKGGKTVKKGIASKGWN